MLNSQLLLRSRFAMLKQAFDNDILSSNSPTLSSLNMTSDVGAAPVLPRSSIGQTPVKPPMAAPAVAPVAPAMQASQPIVKGSAFRALFKQSLFDGKPLGLDNPATNVPPPSTQPATQPAPQPMQQNTLANTFANIVSKHNQPKSPPAQSLPAAPASSPASLTPAAASGAPSAGNAWRGAQSPPEPAAPTQSATAKPAPAQTAKAPSGQPSFFKEYANAMGNNVRGALGAAKTFNSYVPVATVAGEAADAVGSHLVSHVHNQIASPMLRGAASSLPDGNVLKEFVNNVGQRADASAQDAKQQLWRAVTPYSAESQKPYVSADSQVLAGMQAQDNNPVTKSIGGWSDFGTRMLGGAAVGGPAAKVLGGGGKATQLAGGAASLANGTMTGYNTANAMKDYEAGDTNALSVATVPESPAPAGTVPEEAANNMIAAKPSEHINEAHKAAAPILKGGPEAIQSATKDMQGKADQVMGNPETAKSVNESVNSGQLAPNLFDTGWKSLTEMTQDPQKAIDMFKSMSFPEQLGLGLGLGMAGLGLLAYFGSEEGGLGGALMALLGLGVAGGIGANALTGGGIANSALGKAIGGSELGKAIGGMFGGAAPAAAAPGAAPAAKPGAAPAAARTWGGFFANMTPDSAIRAKAYPKMVQTLVENGFSQADAEQRVNRMMPAS